MIVTGEAWPHILLFYHASKSSSICLVCCSLASKPLEDPDNPPGDKELPGSNASTLSATSFTEKDITASSADDSQEADTPTSATKMTGSPSSERSENLAIVRAVLYGTQDNVNIVHEVYRQALLFPFAHAGAMRRVINVYKDWFHVSVVQIYVTEPREMITCFTLFSLKGPKLY